MIGSYSEMAPFSQSSPRECVDEIMEMSGASISQMKAVLLGADENWIMEFIRLDGLDHLTAIIGKSLSGC